MLPEPAHPVHVARPGHVRRLARPEEEERLEEAVIHDVEEPPGEAEERPLRAPRRAGAEADAETEDDDPDVLDAVPGEEALQVVLSESEGDAEDRRGGSEEEERVAPGGGRVGDERREPHDPVDPGLDENARHEGRDVRGGGGMRRREPDVEREDARLQAEAEEGEDEERRPRVAPRDSGRERDELRRAGERAEEGEEAEEDERRDVRREEVEAPRVARLARLPVGRDEEEGRERHHLPRGEEEDEVPRDEDEGDRPGREAEEEAGPRRVARVLSVAEGARAAHGGRCRDEEERGEEERREGVERHVERGARERPRSVDRRDVPRGGGEHGPREAEQRAHDGAGDGDPAPRGPVREDEPRYATGHAEEGAAEDEEEAHRGEIHPRRAPHARSATSVPRT